MCSRLVRLFLLLLGISLLNSCGGFHLRGVVSLPKELQTLYLKNEMSSAQFTEVLRKSLQVYKVNVVRDPRQAPIALHIINTKLNKDASILSNNSQIQQYTLSFTVQYQLLSQNGQVIVPIQSVKSSTTLQVHKSKMMTDFNNLAARYLPGLQRDAASRIMESLLANNNRTALTQYMQKSNNIT